MIKRIKINKTKAFIGRNLYVLISIFMVIVLIISYFLYSDYEKEKLLKDIKNHYSKIIVTTKSTKLYDKNKVIIGNVNKNFTLEIKDKKSIKTTDKYFNIKDTDYYIYYKDVKKINKKIIDKTNSNYLIFNQNIQSKNITFFINNKKVMNIKTNISLPIIYTDDNFYYIKYLDRLMGVKKNSVKIKDKTNTKDVEANYISVINYEKVYDKNTSKCNENNCIDILTLKNNIKTLKSEGFYTITLDEYNSWVNGKIRLKEKAVLLTISNVNDLTNSVEKDENIKLENINESKLKVNDNNTKNTKDNKDSINIYKMKNSDTDKDFIKMLNGENIVKKTIISNSYGKSVPVLNYHFFYDPNIGESCNENICLQTDVFKKQLNYLRDNGYKTLTITEFKKWMYGEIDVPDKSVLITIDDGAMGTSKSNGNKLIPILEEYKMNATLFLITGWWDKSEYQSNYLDVESHGNDIHITGSCGKAKIHCLSKDELVNDFRLSVQKLGTDTAFCFPFYAYNNTAIEAIKEVGFKLGFIGGSRKAKQSDNKFMIPRYPIHKSTSWDSFINMVN